MVTQGKYSESVLWAQGARLLIVRLTCNGKPRDFPLIKDGKRSVQLWVSRYSEEERRYVRAAKTLITYVLEDAQKLDQTVLNISLITK